MIRNLSAWHVIIVLLVVLLLFGAKRLPDLAKSVGQSMKIFKSEVKDLKDDDAPVARTAPASTVATPPVADVPYGSPVRPVDEPSEGDAPPKA